MVNASATERLPLIMSRGAYDTTGTNKPGAQPPSPKGPSAGTRDTSTG